MKLSVTLDTLPEFVGYISRNAMNQGLSDEMILKLEVAMEEAMANVFHHAYKGVGGIAEVTCRGDDARFAITIMDSGGRFDITSHEDEPPASDISEVEIGGQGIKLIRGIFDEIHYSRERGRNILQLVVHKESETCKKEEK